MGRDRFVAAAMWVAVGALPACQLLWPVDDYDSGEEAQAQDGGKDGSGGQSGVGGQGGNGPDALDGGGEEPTCDDEAQNGSESDIDCGGKLCPPCAAGKKCGAASDCATQACMDARCVTCGQQEGWFAPTVTWFEAATGNTSSSDWYVYPAGSAASVTAAVEAQDTARAACDVNPSKDSKALRGKGFKFALPPTAIVKGIQVHLRLATSGTATNHEAIVQLLKAGAPVGANRADSAPVLPNASSYEWRDYGGAEDLWGTTWTPGEINDAGFGVQFAAHNTFAGDAATVFIDVVGVQVHYCD